MKPGKGLVRRTPLRAKTGLQRTPMQGGSQLRRTASLKQESAKRKAANRERTKALRPLREAQTWCSRCGVTDVGLDAHELLSRARGGSITDIDNIVLLCRHCHDFVTTHPAQGGNEGWVMSRAG